jgi:hypothetical protein
MKKWLLLLLLFGISSCYGLNLYVRPAKMVIRGNTSDVYTANFTLINDNPTNITVSIDIDGGVSAEYYTPQLLEINETKIVPVTYDLPNTNGTYESNIIFSFDDGNTTFGVCVPVSLIVNRNTKIIDIGNKQKIIFIWVEMAMVGGAFLGLVLIKKYKKEVKRK